MDHSNFKLCEVETAQSLNKTMKMNASNWFDFLLCYIEITEKVNGRPKEWFSHLRYLRIKIFYGIESAVFYKSSLPCSASSERYDLCTYHCSL